MERFSLFVEWNGSVHYGMDRFSLFVEWIGSVYLWNGMVQSICGMEWFSPLWSGTVGMAQSIVEWSIMEWFGMH